MLQLVVTMGKLSRCDVTGNIMGLSAAHLDDKLNHVGHVARVLIGSES
jgi:hypothetical protein